MDIYGQIIARLKKAGFRLTKIRIAVIRTLVSSSAPLAEEEIRQKLQSLKLSPNKTTIYRQLEKFIKLKFVKEVEFGDGKKRYEMAGSHHHHLVCTSCRKIEDVRLESELKASEQRIAKQKSFLVTEHVLEFFGLCKNCH